MRMKTEPASNVTYGVVFVSPALYPSILWAEAHAAGYGNGRLAMDTNLDFRSRDTDDVVDVILSNCTK